MKARNPVAAILCLIHLALLCGGLTLVAEDLEYISYTATLLCMTGWIVVLVSRKEMTNARIVFGLSPHLLIAFIMTVLVWLPRSFSFPDVEEYVVWGACFLYAAIIIPVGLVAIFEALTPRGTRLPRWPGQFHLKSLLVLTAVASLLVATFKMAMDDASALEATAVTGCVATLCTAVATIFAAARARKSAIPVAAPVSAAPATEPPKVSVFDQAAGHRFFSAYCFNRAWEFIEQPQRSAAENQRMLLLTLASLWHWTQRPDVSDENLSIGYWQASRVCAVAQQADNALRFAQMCMDYSGDLPAFYQGYAHEALARAARLAGDALLAERHLEAARKLAAAVADRGERAALEKDLETVV